jgi:hypothetical protein
VLAGIGGGAFAQIPSINQSWTYWLVDGSYLLDDCLICGRPTIQVPLRGTFKLRLIDQNPLFASYAVEDVRFTGGSGPYHLTGSGTFQIGGEVAIVQEMFLQLEIRDGFTNKAGYFTNVTNAVGRPWPMIEVTLGQTNGSLVQLFSLHLAVAPIREIWFSTANSFTATSGDQAPRSILGGDLISTSGLVVKRNGELFSSVGIHVPGPDLGLDAVDILPGAEIAFSLSVGAPSDTLGPLQHGDLLSTQGRIIRRNQDLLAPFGPQPPSPDVGLDAVHSLDTGEILFSTGSNIFSERLGVTVGRGDLLSSTGTIVRKNQQLLSRFHPAIATNDYGLDALYVWSSGEIWFSTEDGFDDQSLGPISSGDLLSEQGYIVFRNLELLNAFAPLEDPPNFGLDALYVVTDAAPVAPRTILDIAPNSGTQSVTLRWKSQARVFQLQRALEVTGPFTPVSSLLPDLFFDDLGALTNRAHAYYRLQQW